MSSRLAQSVALLLCGALTLSSASMAPGINAGRGKLDMMGELEAKSLPWEYALCLQALGSFRGMIVNALFIRAEEYKNQGRYYDAMQLASAICKFQPRFPSVWEFQSWNMAWNISITAYTPEERWNWIYNGVKLIRDEGIQYNPRAVNLYKQLAWIYVNKMSESVDDFHLVFKRNWAWKMHIVLGPPPDPLGEYRPDAQLEAADMDLMEGALGAALRAESKMRDERIRIREGMDPNKIALDIDVDLPAPEADAGAPQDSNARDPQGLRSYQIVKKAFYDHLTRITEAPDKLSALFERAPRTRELVARLRPLGVHIRDEPLDEETFGSPEGHDGLAFAFFYRYRVLADRPAFLSQIIAGEAAAPDADAENRQRFDEIVGVTRQDPDGQALFRFLQKKTLREVYKLDPRKMAELTAKFGPIDWRLVDAHSLYWVNEGLIAGKETISKFGNDKVNTARIIFFSLRNLLHRNRMTFEPYTESVNYAYINFSPDLNFVEPMHQAYLGYGTLLDPNPDEPGVGGTFRTGHTNFLAEAVRLLYYAGRKRQAARYYEYIRDNYAMQSDGQPNPRYAVPLDRFVRESGWESDSADSWRESRSLIAATLWSAYDSLADGDVGAYELHVNNALDIHSRYTQERKNLTAEKMRFPPFREMQVDALLGWYLSQPPTTPFVTVRKARLWRYLGLDPFLAQAAYDDLAPYFRKECEALQLDVVKAFPEPRGMEQFRKQRGDRSPGEKGGEVETPTQKWN